MAYSKKTWRTGELITDTALNNIENGIAANDTAVAQLKAKTNNASKSTPGIVKQATAVPEASGANPTKAEFKALLDALKAAGIMASS